MRKPKHEHDVRRLVRAAARGPEAARALLQEQPDLLRAKTPGGGESALHYLAIENALSAVRTLATAGADVNSQDSSGSTPLMAAAQLHLVDMVALLLELGADPRAKNEDSDTALHFASRCGADRLVELLITAGADIHARNDLGESFLDLALPRKRPEIMNVLARHGIEESAV